ncbi:MAG: type II toxin-antitoxin system RelE/ParE family toxin [Acidobacteria bacterium]|nr:type II toxin-antitoxin system RelE/ParE family toxin [Acidobacteriota bacterium]
MIYEVEITEQASHEAEEALRWMTRHFPQVAPDWFERLVEFVNSLATFPNRCDLAPESQAFKQKIRQLLFEHYRILFTVKGNSVHVLHSRHRARKTLSPKRKGRST